MGELQKLKVALIQTTLVWEDPQENRNRFSKWISDLDQDTDLVILPEMFTTGFTMSPTNVHVSEGPGTLSWMKELASANELAIIGSMVHTEEGKHYNRLWFCKPDGSHASYDKRHTFTLAGEDKVYTAGQKKLIETYKGFSICPLICYDLRFPVWSRNTEDYDLLLYVANWPEPRVNAWDALLKARAIENMAYCIGVNRVGQDPNGNSYVGHSSVYDCLGEQLAFSDKEQVLYASLEKESLMATRDKLRFLADRDSFTLQL
ncbi:amidohydrolase [Poritiphilus flavus]|uniref:Omega-amidase YafV n=1 Tax=Poritiphilus flavus TaxID=2697053 RepID=A0A6L9ECV2_9FLAO|nr:amidohydrolase [Poritiphilus flavus]NAS12580.1 amidohydrolase [Poritiphilus flavus]